MFLLRHCSTLGSYFWEQFLVLKRLNFQKKIILSYRHFVSSNQSVSLCVCLESFGIVTSTHSWSHWLLALSLWWKRLPEFLWLICVMLHTGAAGRHVGGSPGKWVYSFLSGGLDILYHFGGNLPDWCLLQSGARRPSPGSQLCTFRNASFCSKCLLIMGVTWSVSELGPSLSAPPHQSSSLLYSCSRLSRTLQTCVQKRVAGSLTFNCYLVSEGTDEHLWSIFSTSLGIKVLPQDEGHQKEPWALPHMKANAGSK